MSVKAEQIEITSPCPITLDRSGVSVQDRAMFCAHCTKDVHLLSQMTEPEARELMDTKAGSDICVSYAIRTDGSIRFRTDSSVVPLIALRRRPTPATAPAPIVAPPRRMSLVATIGASLLLAACTPHTEKVIEDQTKVAPPIQASDDPPVLHDTTPCDEPPVAGGLRAEPLPPTPTPHPDDLMVDGGLRAEPLPPEPMVEGGLKAEPLPPPPMPEVGVAQPQARGGMRARPIAPDDPLSEL